MRSPLSRVRGLGAAKSGTQHWLMQRITALALLPLAAYLIVAFLSHVVWGNYDSIQTWIRNPLAAGAVVLFWLTALWHAVLGLQVVIEDYVHHEGMKFTSITVIKFLAAGMAACGVLAVVKIMSGI